MTRSSRAVRNRVSRAAPLIGAMGEVSLGLGGDALERAGSAIRC